MGTREDDRYDYMMECGAWDRANDRIKELEREKVNLEERIEDVQDICTIARYERDESKARVKVLEDALWQIHADYDNPVEVRRRVLVALGKEARE
jgi:hypothetical protein